MTRIVESKHNASMSAEVPFSFFMINCGANTTISLQNDNNLKMFVDNQVGFPNPLRHTYSITDQASMSLCLKSAREYYISIFDSNYYTRTSSVLFTILVNDPTGQAYQNPLPPLKLPKKKNPFPVPSRDSSSDDETQNKIETKDPEKVDEGQNHRRLALPLVLQDVKPHLKISNEKVIHDRGRRNSHVIKTTPLKISNEKVHDRGRRKSHSPLKSNK